MIEVVRCGKQTPSASISFFHTYVVLNITTLRESDLGHGLNKILVLAKRMRLHSVVMFHWPEGKKGNRRSLQLPLDLLQNSLFMLFRFVPVWARRTWACSEYQDEPLRIIITRSQPHPKKKILTTSPPKNGEIALWLPTNSLMCSKICFTKTDWVQW